ncbi:MULTISPECIES: ankyrin repeat domain-containing protein [Pseudomonadaceae]|uniref:Ankyrin repeat domain-containing protein n=1 Tax=Pseudomonas denitrificans TaxID=43306 RepID=A0A9X7MWY1_PSEDE|nr:MULTISPECIES: ankyrin repeat domain-containing protein [Pseudomonadaceae]MBD9684741.1 ankyrin repeat domain-containing protein [Pseudomonas sp. PDM20]QEY71177.1 hypothetical protein F1C79_05705 [Pseudomonas denitrificans (nom. rej.)]
MEMPIVQTEDVHSRAAADSLLGAASDGREAEVAALLKRGVPVDVSDGQGNTPLLLATAGNRVEVARLLIAAGADVNRQNRIHDSAYLLAGAAGRLEILRLTLAHGADLRSTNRYGGTALIPACERGHVEVVATLLKAGVDPDHVNKLGWTGLLEAILLSDGGPRHQAIVKQLIEAGANLNLADNDGVTPLQHARQRNQTTIARMLEVAGAH